MLQSSERRMFTEFFHWLLDVRQFPVAKRNPVTSFLPRIKRGILDLQDLQMQSNLSCEGAIDNLKENVRTIANSRFLYTSPVMARVQASKGNAEENERLFLATQIARMLHPGESPHEHVQNVLTPQKGTHWEARTVEQRVRRFGRPLRFEDCRLLALNMYLKFKVHSHWSSVQYLLKHPEQWRKKRMTVARQMKVTSAESRMLEKICQVSAINEERSG